MGALIILFRPRMMAKIKQVIRDLEKKHDEIQDVFNNGLVNGLDKKCISQITFSNTQPSLKSEL